MASLKELMDLRGRVALVTGGGGHIGGAICDALAELGANMAVLDCVEDSGRKAVERLQNDYRVEAELFLVNLADETNVKNACHKAVACFGRLDILVHCAAFTGDRGLQGWSVPFDQQTADTWRKAIEVNLTSAFVLSQVCTPALEQSGHGSIINILSIYGLVGPDMRLYNDTKMGNPAAYAASKGGLLQLTRWMATVLAPKIRVNAITPGGVWREQPGAFHERYRAHTPLGRMAIESDFKGAAAYLASDLSAYVTGQNLVVDGGWTVW